MTTTTTKTDALRQVAKQGESAYATMLEQGHGIGALSKADRDAITAYDDTFGLSSGGGASLIMALLDVVEAADSFMEAVVPAAHPRVFELRSALDRLAEHA